MTTHHLFEADDGTRLHYVDHPGDPSRPPVLCLHGLTRNGRDFDGVAARLSALGWRVIVPTMRGRGASAHAADPATYALPHYLTDLDALARHAAFERAVHIGTSMGGLLTLLAAAARPGRVAAALLNDISPAIARPGLERIAAYLGDVAPRSSLAAYAAELADREGDLFPATTAAQWRVHAARRARVTADGHAVPDYDPRIADGFSTDPAPSEAALWTLFRAFPPAVPLAAVRGANSDLLTTGGLAAMLDARPDLDIATVPDAGHAPSLEEPEATALIDRLLGRV